ncbi:hypothetical protein HDU76_010902, partial [Blyttiomyces sp. JEL0837]
FTPGDPPPRPHWEYHSDYRLNCMATHLYPEFIFIPVVYEGDPTNHNHLKKYNEFLHRGNTAFGFLTSTRNMRMNRSCIMTLREDVNFLLELMGVQGDRDGSPKNVSKLLKYCGLLFNPLEESRLFDLKRVNIQLEGDIQRGKFNFTDGCGRISTDLLEEVGRLLPKNTVYDGGGGGGRQSHVPSVLQIRAPGIKGVLVDDPFLPRRTVVFRNSMKKLNVQVRIESAYENANLPRSQKGKEIQREESKKDPLKYRPFLQTVGPSTLPLAVLGVSKPQPCGFLNTQICSLLLLRGLPPDTLISRVKQYLDSVKFMLSDAWAAFDFLHLRGLDDMMKRLQKTLSGRLTVQNGRLKGVWRELGVRQQSEVATWKKQESKWSAEERKRVNKVYDDWEDDIVGDAYNDNTNLLEADPLRRIYFPVRKSRRLYGIADHRGILGPNDCVVRVSSSNRDTQSIVGPVAVARNPCYFPSDVVLLNAVDHRAFHHLKDVLIFSTTGDRPHADMSAGGDLDGDAFLVIWDPDIVSPLKPVNAFSYDAEYLTSLIYGYTVKCGISTFNPFLKAKRPQNNFSIKTTIIKALTSVDADDQMIGRVDALLLDFQKFECRPNYNSVLSPSKILEVLNALFSVSVDSLEGVDVDEMLNCLQAEITNSRSEVLTKEYEMLQKCLRLADDAATFIAKQKEKDYLWDFFVNSATVDISWKTDTFLKTFQPPAERPNADLTIKIVKMAERMMEAELVPCNQVSDGSMKLLSKYMSVDLVELANQGMARLSQKLQTVDQKFKSLPHRKLFEYVQQVQTKMKHHLPRRTDMALSASERHISEQAYLEADESRKSLMRSDMWNDQVGVQNYQDMARERDALISRQWAYTNVLNDIITILREKTVDSTILEDLTYILRNETLMMMRELPVYSSRDKVLKALNTKKMTLIISSTGSGKSTFIPHFLANDFYFKGVDVTAKPILVAQPRRNATTSLSQKLTEDRDNKIGHSIGYHIGKTKARVTKNRTMIICCTYGILLSYARRDPNFFKYSVVVLDEVHEDSPELYFILGMLKRAMSRNPFLKVVLMSAKADTNKITKFFEMCEVIEVGGTNFPVTEEYKGLLMLNEEQFLPKATAAVLDIHKTAPVKENTDILVFLPTIAAIEKACREIRAEVDRTSDDKLIALPLHAQVEEEDKFRIIRRLPISADVKEIWRKEAAEVDDNEHMKHVLKRKLARMRQTLDEFSYAYRDYFSDESDYDDDSDDDLQQKASGIIQTMERMETSTASHIEKLNDLSTIGGNGNEKEEDELTVVSVKAVSGKRNRNVRDNEDDNVINLLSDDDDGPAKRQKVDAADDEDDVQIIGIVGGEKRKRALSDDDDDDGDNDEGDLVDDGLLMLGRNNADRNAKVLKRRKLERGKEKSLVKLPKPPTIITKPQIPSPPFDGTRRVIFCTNIAETSLTILSIGYVIDSGLQLKRIIHPTMMIQEFKMENTRKGRAGRLAKGHCVRLYSEEELSEFPEQYYSNPENLDLNLLSILDMYGSVDDFHWYTDIAQKDINWTLWMLQQCGLIVRNDQKYSLTLDGRLTLGLGRYEVSAQMAVFLLSIWRSRTDDDTKFESCVIAAMGSIGSSQMLRSKFSYRYVAKSDNFKEVYSSENGMSSTLARLNVYHTWKTLRQRNLRKDWCTKFRVGYSDMKDVHTMAKAIFLYFKRKKNLERSDVRDFSIEGAPARPGLNPEDRGAFLLERLAAAKFTHLTCFAEKEKGRLKFLYGSELELAQVDRMEEQRYVVPLAKKLILANTITLIRPFKEDEEYFFYSMSDLDYIPESVLRLVPEEFRTRFVDNVLTDE